MKFAKASSPDRYEITDRYGSDRWNTLYTCRKCYVLCISEYDDPTRFRRMCVHARYDTRVSLLSRREQTIVSYPTVIC